MNTKDRRQLNTNPLDTLQVPPLRRLSELDELDAMEDALYEKRLEAICWMQSRGIARLAEVANEDGGLDAGG